MTHHWCQQPLRGSRHPHGQCICRWPGEGRSEEHTSELQSHVTSYAVFCLKKKKHEFAERMPDPLANTRAVLLVSACSLVLVTMAVVTCRGGTNGLHSRQSLSSRRVTATWCR